MTLGSEVEAQRQEDTHKTIWEGGGANNPLKTVHLQEDGRITDKQRNHRTYNKWKKPP